MPRKLRREPDFEQFLAVLRRKGKPRYLPFYEHLASPGFIAARMETPFGRMEPGSDEYLRTYVDFWLGMGFDCIPMERPLRCPMPKEGARPGAVSHGSESQIVIRNREDFENYPWPDASDPVDFSDFEKTAQLLPDGVKIVAGVAMGPWRCTSPPAGLLPIWMLSGHTGRGTIWVSFRRPSCPELLRRLVFPAYREMAGIAHAVGRPFILHSCGNLALSRALPSHDGFCK